MKLLTMKSGEHQCMLYSLAMVLDEEPDVLIEEIGHNGTELWFPGYPVPYNMRGYHMQEFVDVCLARGQALVPIELYPRSASEKEPTNPHMLWSMDDCSHRFNTMITSKRGILIGRSNHGGHACAWNGKKVYDPNGRVYSLGNFSIRECWVLVPSHHSK